MPKDFPYFRDGDPVPGPAVMNMIFAELRRLRRMTGSGDLIVDAGANPPLIRTMRPERMLAQLTGPYSGGYPWKQVVFSPGRTVVETGVTGTAAGDPAFERRKGDTTLTADGTVYEMVRSPASNQWLFPRRSASHPPCTTPFVFTVRGCSNANLVGVAVAVTSSGGTTYAGSTNGSGQVSFSLAPGGYTWTVTPPTNYAAQTLPFTVSSGCLLSPSGANLMTLLPATGYSCGWDACAPFMACHGSGPPYPVQTWPTSLVFNDGIGPVTLSLSGTTSYVGGATRNRNDGGGVLTPVPVSFTFNCQHLSNDPPTWSMAFSYPDAFGGTAHSGYSGPIAAVCLPSFSWAFSVSGIPPTGDPAFKIWGSSVSWDVSN